MSDNGLTTTEQTELSALEDKIERNLQSFVEAGNSLSRIREGKLYRGTDVTFDEYCKRKWNFERAHAYRLIESAEVAARIAAPKMSPIGDKHDPSSHLPRSESVVREVGKAAPGKQAEVWTEAVKTAPKDKSGKPKVTAAHVKRVVKKTAEVEKLAEAINPSEPKEVPTDENGTPLVDREGMIEIFAKRDEFDSILNQFTQLTKSFNQLGPAVTRYLRVQQFQIDVKNARNALSMARPFAVCPYCRGIGRHDGIDCNGCKKCGWVTKSIYDSAPSEVRI